MYTELTPSITTRTRLYTRISWGVCITLCIAVAVATGVWVNEYIQYYHRQYYAPVCYSNQVCLYAQLEGIPVGLNSPGTCWSSILQPSIYTSCSDVCSSQYANVVWDEIQQKNTFNGTCSCQYACSGGYIPSPVAMGTSKCTAWLTSPRITAATASTYCNNVMFGYSWTGVTGTVQDVFACEVKYTCCTVSNPVAYGCSQPV